MPRLVPRPVVPLGERVFSTTPVQNLPRVFLAPSTASAPSSAPTIQSVPEVAPSARTPRMAGASAPGPPAKRAVKNRPIGSATSPRTPWASHIRPRSDARVEAPARRAIDTRALLSEGSPIASVVRAQAAAKPARKSSPEGVRPGPSPASQLAARRTAPSSYRAAASHSSAAGCRAARAGSSGLVSPSPSGGRSRGRRESAAPSATAVARASLSRRASSLGAARHTRGRGSQRAALAKTTSRWAPGMRIPVELTIAGCAG